MDDEIEEAYQSLDDRIECVANSLSYLVREIKEQEARLKKYEAVEVHIPPYDKARIAWWLNSNTSTEEESCDNDVVGISTEMAVKAAKKAHRTNLYAQFVCDNLVQYKEWLEQQVHHSYDKKREW